MAHYFGRLSGWRGAAKRLGGKRSGMTVELTCPDGKIGVRLCHRQGRDIAEIYYIPTGEKNAVELHEGPLTPKPLPPPPAGTVAMCPHCLDTDGDHQDDCERPNAQEIE